MAAAAVDVDETWAVEDDMAERVEETIERVEMEMPFQVA